MGDKSKIEWTDTTWNPLAGCSKISAGCKNCYAIKDATRLAGNPNAKIATKYAGTVKDGNWTGVVNLADDETLTQPLRWQRPRRIFVNSMSDMFHENVPFDWIDRIFAVMAAAPQHTFQVLTKRPERMREYFSDLQATADLHAPKTVDGRFSPAQVLNFRMLSRASQFGAFGRAFKAEWPLPNVWLGVSVENQKAADERIPYLLETPASIRFLSCEPLVEKVNLSQWLPRGERAVGKNGEPFLRPVFYMAKCGNCKRISSSEEWDGHGDDCWCVYCGSNDIEDIDSLNWVIVGGESGPNARQCDVAWIRSIVKQCEEAGTACFVKQLGGFIVDRNDSFGYPDDNDRYWDIEEYPDLDMEENLDGYRDGYQGAPVRIVGAGKKGELVDKWPRDLRVRQLPEVVQ